MSGPIVRKYGFPNFEKIFGEREIQHGADEGETTEATADGAKTMGKAKASAPKAKASAEAAPKAAKRSKSK